jgi:hypothetical protein
MNLQNVIASGQVSYKAWNKTLNQLNKQVQQDSVKYAHLYGTPLPSGLDPIQNMIDLFVARQEVLEQAVLLTFKAQQINKLVQEATPDPTPIPDPTPDPTDPFVHPGGNIVIPNGQNPFKYLIEKAESEFPNPQKGDLIPIYLPAGYIKGIEIGGTGSTPLDRVNVWWGSATLCILGHPDGTRVKPVHNNDGWGATIVVTPTGNQWDGYLRFYDLEMEASGANVLQLGLYGSQTKAPLKGLFFKRCSFFDHPLGSVTTTRPISANQCSLTFIECLWDLPVSQEHGVYSRNPFGNSMMDNCTLTAVGGQIWQEAGRPTEGPFFGYPNGTTTIKNSTFCCYHKDPGRAGSALTMAGSARDWDVLNNIVSDLDESDDVYGSFVAWDGGKHYALNGQDLSNASPAQKKGNYANGKLRIEGNTFVQRNPNRAVLNINSCLDVIVRNNGIYGNKPSDISADADAGIGNLIWEDNNRQEDYQKAIAAGFSASDLVGSQVRVNKQVVGVTSDKISVINDQIA